MATLSIPFPEDVFASLRLSPDETALESDGRFAGFGQLEEHSVGTGASDFPPFARALPNPGSIALAFHGLGRYIAQMRDEGIKW